MSNFNPLRPDFSEIDGAFHFIRLITPYNFNVEDDLEENFCHWIDVDEFEIAKGILTGDSHYISSIPVKLTFSDVEDRYFHISNVLKKPSF